MPKARINFAPHSYIYKNAKVGEEHDSNVFIALYSRRTEMCRNFDSFLQGIEPCPDSDPGKMPVDPVDFAVKENLS